MLCADRWGFEFKKQSDRVMLYKQRGTTKRVEVRRNQAHEDDSARVILKQAGMASEDVEQFIREARN